MIPPPRRATPSPPVTRQFVSPRLRGPAFALASQALIPVVSRHLPPPRSRLLDHPPAATAIPGLPSQPRGA
jgi:hypothetical protein